MVFSKTNFLLIQILFILSLLQFLSNNLVLICFFRETLELSTHKQISIAKRRQELKKKQSYIINLFPRIIKYKLKILNSRSNITCNKNITKFAPITEFIWRQLAEILHKDRNNKMFNSNSRILERRTPFHHVELSLQLVTHSLLKLSRCQNLMSNSIRT